MHLIITLPWATYLVFVPTPKFKQSHYYQAKPEVNHQPQIQPGGGMAGGRRQVSGAGKIERIAD
jgi:hypothetical protein